MIRFALEMERHIIINLIVRVLPLLVAPVLFSCSVDKPGNDIMSSDTAETVANYQVTGTVSDGSGAPVPGIRVVADYSTGPVYRADTLYTDKDGMFSKFLSAPRVDKFFMTFSDIDGTANGGEFVTKYLEIAPIRTEISSGYFGGSFIIRADVILDRK